MAKTVSLTPVQGTNLIRFVLNMKFPEKVGEPGKGGRQFASPDLSAIEEKLRAFKKAMKDVSPIWKDEDKLWFGNPEAFKAKQVPKAPEGPNDELVEDGDSPAKTEKAWDYDQTKLKLTTDVELNGSAARGLAWLLWLWLHPSSQHRLNIGAADELAWPLVEQLKAGAWMKEMLGLDKKIADEITFEDEKPAPAAAVPAAT